MLKPIVKWAGGKRQLLPFILPMIPASFENYVEPFAGGCAVLVELYNLGKIKHAIISDLNDELINLYSVIKDFPEDLINEMEDLPFKNDCQSYYIGRERFNDIIGKTESRSERAALFLYLNRHAFNGLWRVNASGRFNVPFGRYKNPTMPDPEHIKEFSRLLSFVDVYSGDYAETCRMASQEDLVYLDPPYLPVSKTSSFTGYSKNGFPYNEQLRLRDQCEDMGKRGVKIIFNNSYTPEISSLYEKFFKMKVASARMINRNSDQRIGHYDLLGSNFAFPSSQDTEKKNELFDK